MQSSVKSVTFNFNITIFIFSVNPWATQTMRPMPRKQHQEIQIERPLQFSVTLSHGHEGFNDPVEVKLRESLLCLFLVFLMSVLKWSKTLGPPVKSYGWKCHHWTLTQRERFQLHYRTRSIATSWQFWLPQCWLWDMRALNRDPQRSRRTANRWVPCSGIQQLVGLSLKDRQKVSLVSKAWGSYCLGGHISTSQL